MSAPKDILSGDAFVYDRFRELSHWETIQGILYWDMESMMPKASAELRGRQLALMSTLVHEKQTDPKYIEAALALKDPIHARPLRRWILSAICVDAEFVAKQSEVQVKCQQTWKEARQERNFSKVEPYLQSLVEMKREWTRRFKAHPLAKAESAGLTSFEILSGQYEPGFSSTRLDELLGQLGPELNRRIPEIVDKQSNFPALSSADLGTLAMPLVEQEKLCLQVAADLGFEFQRGRLDKSAHPFCGGSPEDTRMTVRYVESDFTNALSSVVHESGHALYEQGLPVELMHKPAGVAASYGIHESQSRFLENQIGRSRAFCRYLGKLTGRSPEVIYRHVNKVEASLIRVDADEVTYNLHILVRYELERRLINGEIEAKDLPRLWNAEYKKCLGVDIPHDGDGVMQDVHWYCGAFGYFATYTIGNLVAAGLFADFRLEVPDWESQVEQGRFEAVKGFLRNRVHRHAATHDSPGTIRLALGGQDLSIRPFLDYVDAKYMG